MKHYFLRSITTVTALIAALAHVINLLHAILPPLRLADKDSGGSRKKDRRASGQQKRGRHTMANPRRPLWTIAVAVIFLGALYSLNQVATESTLIEDVERSQTAAKAKQHRKSESMDYNFYDLFKATEVSIAADSDYRSEKQDEQSGYYLIQAGSFKTPQKAERQRAELTLIGLSPQIVHGSKHNGELWYRVQLGPFTSRSEMAEAKATLQANDIALIVKKFKQ